MRGENRLVTIKRGKNFMRVKSATADTYITTGWRYASKTEWRAAKKKKKAGGDQ